MGRITCTRSRTPPPQQVCSMQNSQVVMMHCKEVLLYNVEACTVHILLFVVGFRAARFKKNIFLIFFLIMIFCFKFYSCRTFETMPRSTNDGETTAKLIQESIRQQHGGKIFCCLWVLYSPNTIAVVDICYWRPFKLLFYDNKPTNISI